MPVPLFPKIGISSMTEPPWIYCDIGQKISRAEHSKPENGQLWHFFLI